MGTIKVIGKAEKEFTADIMEIVIEINVANPDYSKTLSQGNEETEKLLKILTDSGYNITDILLNKEDVSQDESESGKKYYEFNKAISFTTGASPANLVALSDELCKNKIKASYDHTFKLSNRKELENAVLKEALTDSRKKAEMISETFGQKITGIEKVDCDLRYYAVYAESNKGDLDAILRCRTTNYSLSEKISPDKIKLSKEIEVTWIME